MLVIGLLSNFSKLSSHNPFTLGLFSYKTVFPQAEACLSWTLPVLQIMHEIFVCLFIDKATLWQFGGLHNTSNTFQQHFQFVSTMLN